MKQVNSMRTITASLFFAGTLLVASCSSAQKTTVPAEPVATSIDSSRWNFTVTMVKPQDGLNRQPNGLYSVVLKPGNLNVYLPYFGRAFNAAEVYGSNKSALDFISKDFTVEKEQQGEGKWLLKIKPKDQPQVQSMTFTIFSNGSGSLDIIMTNRTPMSFSGTVSRAK